jgi:hypothetical protein
MTVAQWPIFLQLCPDCGAMHLYAETDDEAFQLHDSGRVARPTRCAPFLERSRAAFALAPTPAERARWDALWRTP